ncbi:MAG TPA: NAD(P)/FAD-dependent oxidoreductase [Acidimicrobiales bacterium]|nr:NAD(P)/FAD-dependent oxidoreductase [Acidimicrobiales bacterium]
MPDAVVIGSGPNGLVAANLLADQGWDVVVLEAQAHPGGGVRSSELIEPGYVNDLFSAFYPLAVASPVFASLDLAAHGLRWRRAPLALAHPASDGTCPVISTDLDETASSLDALAPGDGDAWRRLFRHWQQVGDPLVEALCSPFPPVRAGLRLLGAQRPSELLRFARFLTLPVRRLGEEEFTSDGARRLLAGTALHTDLSPESTLGATFGWLLASLAQDRGWPVPEGGAGQLTEALLTRLEKAGGEVRCDTPVAEIIVRSGRAVAVRSAGGMEVEAGRAVIADVSAPALFLDLVAAEHLPPRMVDDVRRFHWDSATAKVDWTLDGPIPWTAEPARRAGTVHIGDSLDALSVQSAQLAVGLVPDPPFILLGQQNLADPTRQPEGKATAWAYTHVPRHIRGDAGEDDISGRWDDREAAAIADRMEGEIERLAPGFGSLIRGRHIFTPLGLEAANANLARGATNGGTAQLHQQLVFRPSPGLGRPETPVAGLFLGSSSAHPGGGVHGACGANAAKAAIWADRRDRGRRQFARWRY